MEGIPSRSVASGQLDLSQRCTCHKGERKAVCSSELSRVSSIKEDDASSPVRGGGFSLKLSSINDFLICTIILKNMILIRLFCSMEMAACLSAVLNQQSEDADRD
jgi:hypothetical protein